MNSKPVFEYKEVKMTRSMASPTADLFALASIEHEAQTVTMASLTAEPHFGIKCEHQLLTQA